jgi:ABC-type sulfate/molybdate transport systems ATPase subunit
MAMVTVMVTVTAMMVMTISVVVMVQRQGQGEGQGQKEKVLTMCGSDSVARFHGPPSSSPSLLRLFGEMGWGDIS